jgi:hypothetical protein
MQAQRSTGCGRRLRSGQWISGCAIKGGVATFRHRAASNRPDCRHGAMMPAVLADGAWAGANRCDPTALWAPLLDALGKSGQGLPAGIGRPHLLGTEIGARVRALPGAATTRGNQQHAGTSRIVIAQVGSSPP